MIKGFEKGSEIPFLAFCTGTITAMIGRLCRVSGDYLIITTRIMPPGSNPASQSLLIPPMAGARSQNAGI